MDLAGGLQGHFGQQRADQLVDEDGEQRDVADEVALRAELARRHAHAERDAGLRQQGDAEILADLRLTFHELCGVMRAEVFAERARQDIHDTDQHDQSVLEHAQIQPRAGDDEERREQRARPPVGFFHDLSRQRAEVAEQRAEHHARQKRREADRDRADLELRHGQRRGQKDERDGHVQAVRVGVEELFQLRQHPAAERAERERADDLDERVDDDGDHVERAGIERLRNAERHREHHQTDRVVQRDDRQQQVDQRALGLILPDDHQRGGRGRRRGDGAEGDGLRDGELAARRERDGDERDIDQEGGGQRLQNADDERLLAGMLELRHAELAADGERDEAQRDLRDQRQAVHILLRREAKPLDAEKTQAVRADEHARDQIRRHRGGSQSEVYPAVWK